MVADADPHVRCRSLAQKYNMPMELAVSLAGLALYDTVIMVDDSGMICHAGLF